MCNSSSQNESCYQLCRHNEALQYALIAVAVTILALLIFTQRRTRLCTDCLWGVPGLVVPVNLLSMTRFRLIYAVIFGALSSTIIEALINGTFKFDAHGHIPLELLYRFVLEPVLTALYFALIFFPLFACVNAPVTLIGHIMGLIYSILSLASIVTGASYKFSGCSGLDHTLSVIAGIGAVPIYACFVAIILWYFRYVVTGIWNICYRRERSDKREDSTHGHQDSQYYKDYVKRLLKREPEFENHSSITQCLKFFTYYNKDFKFPLKFLGTLFVMVIILFQLSVLIFSEFIYLGIVVVDLWKDNGIRIVARLLDKSNTSTEVTDVYMKFHEILKAGAAVMGIAPCISCVLCLLLLIHLVASVHKDLQKVAVHGISQYLSHTHVQSLPSFKLAASLRYAGIQIGFFVWAWLIYWVIFLVLGFFGVLIYIGLKYNLLRTIAVYIFGLIIVGVGWTVTVLLAQVLACKFIFLEKGSKTFLFIKNRRLFNWFAYLLFFYNILLGFIAAILRVLIAFFFGLLLLFRLDRVILMKGFEFADFGHRTYIGFLYVEHSYNNAIVNTFVQLMKEAVGPGYGLQDSRPNAGENYLFAASGKPRASRAHNRWLVAYTLLRNPSLQGLTASRLKEGKEGKSFSSEGFEMGNYQSKPGSRSRAAVLSVVPTHYDSL